MVAAPEGILPYQLFAQGTQPDSAPSTLCTEAPPTAVTKVTSGCPVPTCKSKRSWGRHQEFDRHVLTHLPHSICCPHKSCPWRGSRRYAVKDHWGSKHPDEQAPDLDSPEAFTIYDAKPLVQRLINKEVTLEQAKDEADALVREKAVELGKWDLWNMRYE